MIAVALGARRVDEALRVVRALGAHRYVAGRLHMVHAFALAAVSPTTDVVLRDARAFAVQALSDPQVDPASRDPRLWRRVSDVELVAILDAFWSPAATARDALVALLAKYDLAIGSHTPFDEGAEKGIHPLVIDAGWELLPLSSLDAERHKGAMAAFGDAHAFERARFDEGRAIPPRAPLYELPALGAVELLRGVTAEGVLAEPFVLWVDGPPEYVDYVVRGVRRAAKVGDEDSAGKQRPPC